MRVLLILTCILLVSCTSNDPCEDLIDLMEKPEPVLDYNGDGIDDVFYEYDKYNGFQLIDRNYDLKIDVSHKFDKQDNSVSSRLDDNFDGVLETLVIYENEQPKVVFVDINADSSYELVFHYDFGVLTHAEKYYQAVEGNSAKIGLVNFDFGYPISQEVLTETKLTQKEFINQYSQK